MLRNGWRKILFYLRKGLKKRKNRKENMYVKENKHNRKREKVKIYCCATREIKDI